MPSSVLDNAIPYNVLHPSARLFHVPPKIFGCVCYVYDNRPSRTKLEPKSIRCLFLGYSATQKGYRCFSPTLRRYFVSCDVAFVENISYYPNSDPTFIFESGGPPIMTILQYPDIQNDSSSPLQEMPSAPPAPPAPPITQVYTRRDKTLPVDTNNFQSTQDLETCSTPNTTLPPQNPPSQNPPSQTLDLTPHSQPLSQNPDLNLPILSERHLATVLAHDIL